MSELNHQDASAGPMNDGEVPSGGVSGNIAEIQKTSGGL